MNYRTSLLFYSDPVIRAKHFENKALRLTDARRVGIMLRDKFFTLRDHSAITTLAAESVSEGSFRLRVTAYGGNNYVRVDGNRFKADGDSSHAAEFSARMTVLGQELFYHNGRPAIFDGDHDVRIGPWSPTSEKSQVPILIWSESLADIWAAQSPQQASEPGVQNRALDQLLLE